MIRKKKKFILVTYKNLYTLCHLKVVEPEEKCEVTDDGHKEGRHYDIGDIESVLVLKLNLHLQNITISFLDLELQLVWFQFKKLCMGICLLLYLQLILE